MIVPGSTFDLVWHVVVLATGLPKTSGTMYAYVRRQSDGYWLKANGTWTASTTAPTGADVPTATHTKAGIWKLTLSTTTTSGLTPGEFLHGVAADSETEASVTVASDMAEEMVESAVDVSTGTILDAIESQRGHHTTQKGNFIYVGPVNGNDTTGNGTRYAPYKTVTKALSMVTLPHTCIYVLADQGNGVTTLTENITWNQRYTFLRGPGRDLVIKGASANTPTITVTVNGAEFSGFQLESHASGANADGIEATSADFLYVHHVWINATQGTGIDLINCSNARVNYCDFQATGASAAGHGLLIACSGVGNSNYNEVCHNVFADVQGDAIRMTKAGAGTNNNAVICENHIHGSTAYGINVGVNVTDTFINDNRLLGNTSGNINDSGTNTHAINNEQWATSAGAAPSAAQVADAVWDELFAGHGGVGSFGALLQDTKAVVDTIDLETDPAAIADAVLDEALAGHTTPGTVGEALNTLSTILDNTARLLGLVHDNTLVTDHVYDGDDNLTSANIKIYDSPSNAQAAANAAPTPYGTGLLYVYEMHAEYTDSKLTNYYILRSGN